MNPTIAIEPLIETLTFWVKTYSMKVVAAILILLVGRWLARKFSRLLSRILEKNRVDVTLVKFLEKILFYTLMVIVLIAAAGQLGINTTSF